MKRTFCMIFMGMLLLVLTCGGLWAQVTAQITGTAKDESGAVLPGVEIIVTQAETGISRNAITNETGSYVLPNLPIGPYRLEAALPGFRTYVQTGIVLQVNSNPAINVVLQVGQVSEQVEVQANATLVETRNAGIGQVMENASIIELPLNGRSMIELVALTPAVTPAGILDAAGRDPFARGNVSVAGGLNSGLNYTLDGAFHNNPYDNSYLSMPFPDALQEFKVDTGASGAQNGVKSSGTVSLVTKTGTNQLHGNLFEFVRNGMFNARNAFAERRDTLKRNQFGGTLGGPILRDKLFFFGAYQGTILREDPASLTQYVPTPAMLAGDFTTITSPACNAGRQIALKAPFIDNRIDPALFTKPAVLLSAHLPKTSDPCGKVLFGMPRPTNGHMVVGRLDYQINAKHSVFGRYLIETTLTTAPYDITHNILAVSGAGIGNSGRAQAFAIGDTYLFGANVVNSLRLSTDRQTGTKPLTDFSDNPYGPRQIGVKAYDYGHDFSTINVTGGFQVWCGGCGDGPSKTAIFATSDDLSVIRGDHQLAFGAQWAGWWVNAYSRNYTHLPFTFNGQTTGLGMADFFMGNVSSFTMGPPGDQNKKNQSLGVYSSDTWKLNQKLTLNYGLRWEPYFPLVNLDGAAIHFDMDALRKGIKTTQFDKFPPGLFFPGDPGHPGLEGMYKKWWNLSPRLGLAWDLTGDGRTSLRAAMGQFYDFIDARFIHNVANGAPWAPRYQRSNVQWADPWATEPGGDPFPLTYGRFITRDAAWPNVAYFLSRDYDSPNMQVAQWNLSLQRQVGTDWLVSASYLGNHTIHKLSQPAPNPAVFLGLGPCTLNGVNYATCSTTGNTDARRRISLERPALGQYFGDFQVIDSGGTASYNGMVLSVQRRAARSLTVSGNYTWSHCISDGTSDLYAGMRRDRSTCSTDRRQVFNVSALAETPRFSSTALRAVGSGWRVSPIFKLSSGADLTVTSGLDRALTGVGGQRANQVLLNPYAEKSVKKYLNFAAFEQPALGTLGNMGGNNFPGPGSFQFDVALSRTFQFHEAQRLEFRAEAFNVTNSFRMNDPGTTLNANTFGQVTSAKDPRIMQFVLKYVF